MRIGVNLFSKMWYVREHASTKLGQEDSLGLGMMVTWKKT
jgi:hypothetical protein